jgi:hypothetical protein
MNLCRCERGHFYDKEKFPTCPHCAGGSATDESLTAVFTEDVTASVGEAVPDPPFSNAAPIQDITPLPIADLPANQPTVAMNIINGPDEPTIPLDPVENNTFYEASDDDDHTVGFFDDEFFASPTSNTSAAHAAPVAKPVNKVSTPCVGWLVAVGGAHIGTDFRLKVGKNFIGRSSQMDVALTEDKSVSRDRHAIVVYEPKEHLYLIQPGEASTLVYKNNEVVLSPAKLEAYDVITVGDVNLLFIPLCNKQFNWSDLLEEMKRR